MEHEKFEEDFLKGKKLLLNSVCMCVCLAWYLYLKLL